MGIEDELSTKIAGEIVLSREPSKTIRKWRELFNITQVSLADKLGMSASVISDYESGRRRSPGAKLIRKIVEAILEVDEERGSQVIRAYERMSSGGIRAEAIIDIREFASPTTVEDICKIVNGRVVANKQLLEKPIYGYTVIDSLKAILDLSSDEFLRLYGLTSERALIFTRVSSGRSPFVAIRVSSIKPGLVVLQGLDTVDALGIKIAERERIPVILSKIEDVKKLVKTLRRNTS